MEATKILIISKDSITIMILVAFLLLVICRTYFPQRFQDFSLLFATNKYLLLKGREPKLFHPFNLLLFAVNIISVSLFIFIVYQQLYPLEAGISKVIFIRIATAYATFILLKFSVEEIMANILSVDKKMNYYLFHKLSYRNFMAMLLLPLNIIFIYIWEPSLMTLYISIGFLLFLNILSLSGIILKNRQYIMRHWFYFILYLCALEIGPYFILYKLITIG